MKTKLVTLITFFFSAITITFAQDEIIYTIQAKWDNEPFQLDSILVENLQNGTTLVLNELPEQDVYTINLTTGDIEESVRIDNYDIDNLLSIVKNTPGNLEIDLNSKVLDNAGVFVYNTLGQVLWMNSSIKINHENNIHVQLPDNGVYLIKIATSFGAKTIMSIGSSLYSSIEVTTTGNQQTVNNISYKSAKIVTDEFSFQQGDSLRVSAFHGGYYARPVIKVLSTSASITFNFNISQVDLEGISDVYTNVNDTSFTSINYSVESSTLTIVPENEGGSIYVGDILTIDLDTAGYLRKVVGVKTNPDGSIVLETEQATMNELFVSKTFKLNTSLIEPTTRNFKSTGSMMELSQALTDEDGYIHPVKIVLFDENGEIQELSALNLKSTSDEIRQAIVDEKIDFSNTDLYGVEGDNVHFFVSEGNLFFKTDAVFEFDFTYEGEFDEETKVKKSDLNKFEFYLEATAGVQTKLELDMADSWTNKDDDSEPEHLFKIVNTKAKFVVPPGVPVWIDFDINMYRDFILEADASLHANWGFEVTDTLTLGGTYTKETKDLIPINEFKHYEEIYPLNIEGEINASARLELFPRVDIKLYSIFGPYAEVVPYVKGNYHGAAQVQITPEETETFFAYNADLNLGLDFRIGTQFDLVLFDKEYGPKLIEGPYKPLWWSPANLELVTQLPTEVATGNTLTLDFTVTDNLGLPLNLASVYFEGDGFFSKYIGFTDEFGKLSVDWSIGETEGSYDFKATIFNADKTDADYLNASVTAINQNPPTADFTSDQTTIEVEESIQFTDISTNNPNSWSWDFGDGETSILQNPTHTYSAEGTYDVKLTVTNIYGSDSITKTGYINVYILGCPDCETGTITDIDGNIYQTVKIGNQWWMAENLATTKYNSGVDIPLITNNSQWTRAGYAYCWYNNDEYTYKNICGALYNWHIASRNDLCPSGWHVPTKSDYIALITFLGGELLAGGKLKDYELGYWDSPNTGATNSSGFTARPTGIRHALDGNFYTGKKSVSYWLSTENSDGGYPGGEFFQLFSDYASVHFAGTYKTYGFPIRCIKD